MFLAIGGDDGVFGDALDGRVGDGAVGLLEGGEETAYIPISVAKRRSERTHHQE